MQRTFGLFKQERILRQLLELYGIESDMPRGWVNPAAVVRLYPAKADDCEHNESWTQDLEVIQLGDLRRGQRNVFYSEPLDLQKLVKELKERQQTPELRKMYEDWDPVVDGQAVSEGAELDTKVFVRDGSWW
ncbi:hypothetical protein JCM10296v2_003169 [Rhodotorula toruloides]